MANQQVISQIRAHIQVGSTELLFAVADRAVEVGDGEEVFCLLDLQNPTADFLAVPYTEYSAVRPERPDTPTIVSSTYANSTNPQRVYQETLSATDKTYVRVGIAAKLKDNPTESVAEATATLTIMRAVKTMRLGSATVSVGPMPASKEMFVPIGPPRPTVGVNALKGTVSVQSLSGGDVSTQMAVRLYTDDPEGAGTWAGIEQGFTVSQADEERVVDEVDPSTQVTAFPDAAWYQPGLLIKVSATDVSATVKVVALAVL